MVIDAGIIAGQSFSITLYSGVLSLHVNDAHIGYAETHDDAMDGITAWIDTLSETPTPTPVITREAIAQVVAAARTKAIDTRWLNALNKAYAELLLDRWQWNGTALMVASRTSSRRYNATERTCECTAYAKGSPCWHRAAARIVATAVAK